jgi:murein DD-endopeptidase MepM/ murein hydrolase activator NlpD
LVQQEAKADQQEQTMKERLTIMYMNGEASYLEMLFEANNMNAFFERIELVKSVVSFDNNILKELKKTRDAIAQTKEEQTQLKDEMVELQKQVLAKKEETATKKQEYETLKAQLSAEQAKAEDQLEQLEKDSKALEAEIQKLQEALRYADEYAGGIMTWPVPGYYRITSSYGYRIHPIYGTKRLHTGIDIGSNYDSSGNKISINGEKIVSGADGVVILSQYYSGYGECVIVDHGGGVTTLYGHASKRVVSVGQQVKAGQTLSYVGSTGASTGPHLHFEVRENGKTIDPMGYLK